VWQFSTFDSHIPELACTFYRKAFPRARYETGGFEQLKLGGLNIEMERFAGTLLEAPLQ
jgi:hypothetical protein